MESIKGYIPSIIRGVKLHKNPTDLNRQKIRINGIKRRIGFEKTEHTNATYGLYISLTSIF